MNLSKIAVNRPVSTVMLMLVIVVLGAVSFTGLSLDLYPKINLPMAVVLVQYPNAGSEEVETMVTRPLERQVATVQNLSRISSISTEGSSVLQVEFTNGTNMDFACLHLREAVDMISTFLPDTVTKPIVIPMNPDMMPMSYIYLSGDVPMWELQRLIDDEILPAFSRTEGVASAYSFGGRSKEIRIELIQERLAGYNLTLSQLSQLLAAENVNLPSGDVSRGERKLIVRTMGEFQSVEELRNLPITLPTREVIVLGDLGTVSEQDSAVSSIGRMNGENAIGIQITKQTVANTVEVSRELHKVIAAQKEAHPDLDITVSFDQADFINDSVANVAETAILGTLLAIFVCFFFLRNLASTLIIAVSIPTSIIATFILMYFNGLTMNILSLSGLAVGVGMLVDDSIVVMENVYRLRNEGIAAPEASITGARQVTMPVFAATLTKIAVFLPIVFVEGLAATIFKEFSYTISFALICSLVVALTVVPMLCSRLLNIKNIPDFFLVGKKKFRTPILPAFDRGIRSLTESYVRLLRFSLRHRKSVIAVALVLLISSTLLVGLVGGELMPPTDEGSFSISVSTPYGNTVTDTDKLLQEIEAYVKSIPELKSYSSSAGGASNYGLVSGRENLASVSVNLVDKKDRKRTTSEVVREVSAALKYLIDTEISVTETSTVSFTTAGSSVSVSVKGDDITILRNISNDLTDMIKGISGTANVANSMGEGNPEVQIRLDRNKAASFGISSYQLAQVLESALSGVTATTLKVNGTETDIILSLDDTYSESLDNMLQISMTAPSGQKISVGELAEVRYDNSPIEIDRVDQVRTAVISSGLNGRDLQSVTNDIEAALRSYNMPNGYTWSIGGEAQEMVDSYQSLIYALLLAVLLVYMILATQFESLVQPFIIMLAIPFALTGAFMGLFLTNTPLSLVAFLGIIMLSGIVVNNSILLIDFINQNKSVYSTREEAIVNSGRHRLRPIIMTGLTTCLGLLPLSMGIGSGGEMQAPMGITVIGGLAFSTIITLVIVPVIYTMVDDRSERTRRRRLAKRQRKIEKLRAAGILPEDEYLQSPERSVATRAAGRGNPARG